MFLLFIYKTNTKWWNEIEEVVKKKNICGYSYSIDLKP